METQNRILRKEKREEMLVEFARFFGSHVSRFLKPSDIRQIIAWAGRIVWKRLKLEVEREKKKKLSSVL